jgi:hypothetical protein
MTNAPPERPGGQDDGPDTLATVVVVLRLLSDVANRLRDDGDHDDLLLRMAATRSVLLRLRERLAKP